MKKIIIFIFIVILAIPFLGCGEASKLNSFVETHTLSSNTGMNTIILTPTSFVQVKNSSDIGLITKEGVLCYATKNAVKNVEIGKTYDLKYLGFNDTDIILLMGVNNEITKEDNSTNTDINNDVVNNNVNPYEDWIDKEYGHILYKISPEMKITNENVENNGNTEIVNVDLGDNINVFIGYYIDAIGITETFMNKVEKVIDTYNVQLSNINIDKNKNSVEQSKYLKYLIYNSKNDNLTALFNQNNADILIITVTTNNITNYRDKISKFINTIQYK